MSGKWFHVSSEVLADQITFGFFELFLLSEYFKDGFEHHPLRFHSQDIS